MAEDANTKEMLVITFPGMGKANEFLSTLKELNHQHLVHLGDAAVVTRDHQGKVSFVETHDLSTQKTAIAGALAGALIGGLTSGKWIEGAAVGGGAGFVAGKVVDLGFKDDYLREVGKDLQNDSSAVVAVVHFENVEQALQMIHQHAAGGRVLRTTLPADVAGQLSQQFDA